MTEQELIEAGFERQETPHEVSNNGYDYYYYIMDLCDGVCLITSDSVDVKDDHWIVRSFEIPSIKIETVDQLNQFLAVIRVITGCDV